MNTFQLHLVKPTISNVELAAAVQDAHPFVFSCLADASLAVLQLLDYLYMRCVCNDKEGSVFPNAPTRVIDLVWCVALTNTTNYELMCGGKGIIHRNPTRDPAAIKACAERTSAAYKHLYNHDVPTDYGGVGIDAEEEESSEEIADGDYDDFVVPDDDEEDPPSSSYSDSDSSSVNNRKRPLE